LKKLNKNSKCCKALLLSFLLLVVFTLSQCSSLHKPTNAVVSSTIKLNSDILVGPGECVLKKFQGTSVNNKFYLYWLFQSNSDQFLFEIESSVNGKSFKPCYFKHGALSPGTAILMLTMTDSMTKNDVVFYRIKAVPENFPIKNKIDEEYKSLFSASTIMVKKNSKTKNYMQD
jgi:hypothetical protein